MSDNREEEITEPATDSGSGDPGTDRAFLQDQPPAQVDDEQVQTNAEQGGPASDDAEPGDIAAAAQD